MSSRRPLPRVVGICGVRRAGKDTVAAHLVAREGYEVVRIAAPLKRLVATAFDLSPELVEGPEKDTHPVAAAQGRTPRALLQWLGDAFKAEFGEDFWMRQALRDVDEALARSRGVVIPDVRFAREAQLLRAAYGDAARVVRETRGPWGPRGAAAGGAPGVDAHASETQAARIHVDACVVNAEDVPALLRAADRALAALRDAPPPVNGAWCLAAGE